MTTKTLTGTYSAGYTLETPVTRLRIAAPGYVEGTGVATANTATTRCVVVNDGRIEATSHSDIAGVYLDHGGSVTNDAAGRISGYRGVDIQNARGMVRNLGEISALGAAPALLLGAGGSVTNGSASDATALVEGDFGVSIGFAAGYRNDAVTNFGTIEATSNTAGAGVYVPGGTVTNGSATDETALISGRYGVFSGVQGAIVHHQPVFTLVNFGTVQGTGGVFTAGVYAYSGAVINGSASDHTALIEGYNGVESGVAAGGNYFSSLVNYGTIVGSNHGSGVNVLTGTITNGSAGDETAMISGLLGIAVSGASEVFNFGVIQGAATGVLFDGYSSLTNGSATDSKAVVEGGLGVGANVGNVITNFGTIIGTAGTAISLGGAGSLVAEAGSRVIGMVYGGGAAYGRGTLELTSGRGSISGLGATATATATGAVTMTFSAFEFYRFDTGTSWTLNGANTIASRQTVTTDGTLVVSGVLTNSGTLSVAGAAGGTAMFRVGGTMRQAGGVIVGAAGDKQATVSILEGGVWEIHSGTITLASGGSGRFVDDGRLIVDTGKGLSAIDVPMFDDGTVEVAGGTLYFTANLFGTGTLTIDAGATLVADRSAIRTLTVGFAGTGATLGLRSANAFAATIGGFAASDTLDLLLTKATGASVNGDDQLVIVNQGVTIASLQLTGSYVGATFSVGSDGAGGTDIKLVDGANRRSAPSPHLLAAAMATLGSPPGLPATVNDRARDFSWTLARPGTCAA